MKYIQRHGKVARGLHWAHTVSCLSLFATGLLLFVPAIAGALSVGVLNGARMVHRVMAVAFIAAPILAMAATPGGAKHFFGEMFARWDKDDWEFMRKFLPYLFSPKKTHMPKQHQLKSGQRFADWVLITFSILIAVSGVLLWAERFVSSDLIRWMLLLHDVAMIPLGIVVMAHAYLGAGVFQPYRGSARLMFGDGKVPVSDALYHWGHWAEAELKSGKNVVTADGGARTDVA